MVLVFAEFFPKKIFMLRPNFFLGLLAVPIIGLYYAFYPVVWSTVHFSRFFTKVLLRLPYRETKPVLGLRDLSHYIENSERGAGSEEVDARLFNNALEFKGTKVRDCMVPRTELIGIDKSESNEAVKKLFISSGHTRLLVYDKDIDNVIGYCYALDFFRSLRDKSKSSVPLLSIPIVPETTLARALLIELLSVRKNIALIVDEYGGTAGIATVEDIIEEIFGELHDEHDDKEDITEDKIDDSTYIFSGRLEIDGINEKHNLALPAGDYDTLSGLLLSISERIPEIGDTFDIEGYRLQVHSKSRQRIEDIKLMVKSDEV